MQVLVKKSVLDQLLNQLIENRGYHSRRIDQIMGDEKPVLPDAQMATQLATSGVPVGDPDFLPVNKTQLSSAASQMALQVAPDKLQKFYSGLKKLIRKTGEKKQYKGMSQTDLMERLNPIIEKILAEADDESADKMTKDATKAALAHAARGGAETLQKVIDRQAAAIRREQNKTIKKAVATDDTPVDYGSPDDIDNYDQRERRGALKRRIIMGRDIDLDASGMPLMPPVELADRVKGDVRRVFDVFAKRDIPIPGSLVAARLTLDMIETEDNVKMVIRGSDGSEIISSTYSKIGSELPFTIRQYEKTFILLFREAIKDRAARGAASMPASVEAETSPESGDDTSEEFAFRIYYAKLLSIVESLKDNGYIRNDPDPQFLEQLAVDKSEKAAKKIKKMGGPAALRTFDTETLESIADINVEDLETEIVTADLIGTGDIPETSTAASLRNTATDLAYVFGQRAAVGTSSPKELSGTRVDLYNALCQDIYDELIKKPGIKKAKEVYSELPEPIKAAFKSSLPKEAQNFSFENLLFENDFFAFLSTENAEKDRIMELLDDCIKAYLKSDYFRRDFKEFADFREGKDAFTALKNVSQTEFRLGIKDTNSLKRFVAGFDLLKMELVGRCVDYLLARDRGEQPPVAGIIKDLHDDLEALISDNGKLRASVEDTLDEISEFPDISMYTEPTSETLVESITNLIKNAPAGLIKKRDALLDSLIDSYVNAYRQKAVSAGFKEEEKPAKKKEKSAKK